MNKSAIQQLVSSLPDHVEVDELVEGLYLLDSIERAEAQISAGDTIEHEDVRKRLAKWLT